MTYSFSPSTSETEARESLWVQGLPSLHSYKLSSWSTRATSHTTQHTHQGIPFSSLEFPSGNAHITVPCTLCRFSWPAILSPLAGFLQHFLNLNVLGLLFFSKYRIALFISLFLDLLSKSCPHILLILVQSTVTGLLTVPVYRGYKILKNP